MTTKTAYENDNLKVEQEDEAYKLLGKGVEEPMEEIKRKITVPKIYMKILIT